MKTYNFTALLLLLLFLIGLFTSCSDTNTTEINTHTTSADTVIEEPAVPQSMRVVSYVLGDQLTDEAIDHFDSGHFDTLTDIIFFYYGTTQFDRTGNVWINGTGEEALENLQELIEGYDIRLHIFLQGPDVVWGGVDEDYKSAFDSGVLELNIKYFLKAHKLDGVNFDCEFPDTEEDYLNFSNFIVSLKEELGDELYVGCAMNADRANYTQECMEALDMVELMSYDYYENNGDHATFRLAEEHVDKMIDMGYSPEKINLGLPFYARPSDRSAYWYDWGAYYDQLNGSRYYFCSDMMKSFYFNDESLIYEKTTMAIEKKLGGMMVWHYTSDAPSDSGHSLFSAIQRAKDDAGIE